MYLLLLSFFPLLSAYNRPADESMLLDLSPNEFKPVKVNTRSTFLNIDIPAGAKGKEATYNLNTFKWLTEQVYPELSQKRNPVNNFIYSALKVWTSQPDSPLNADLLLTGIKNYPEGKNNPDFLLWLGYIYQINSDHATAIKYMKEAFSKIYKNKKIKPVRKFICGIVCTNNYYTRNTYLKSIAAKTAGSLVSAINHKELTGSESSFIVRKLSHHRHGTIMYQAFVKDMKKLKQPDPWLIYTCKGIYEIKKAWLARGKGYANTVDKDGWKGFFKHLNQAEILLTKAWKLHPERPQAPTAMIPVAMGKYRSSIQSDVTWFNRAVAAQVDYIPAYKALLWSRRPRWRGSHDQMLQIGHAALLSKMYDTKVPMIYLNALIDIAGEMPYSNWQAPFRKPGVHDQLEELCREMLKRKHPIEDKIWLSSLPLYIRLFCGHYEQAANTLEKLKNPAHFIYNRSQPGTKMDFTNPSLDHIRMKLDLFNGPFGKRLIEAENLCIDGKREKGRKIFLDILPELKDKQQKKYIFKRLAKSLIEKCEESSYKSDSGLHIAAYEHNIEAIRILIKAGADVRELDAKQRNALHIAFYRNSSRDTSEDCFYDITNLLTGHGIDINSMDSKGRTPLVYHVRYSNSSDPWHINFLIDRGADINVRDNAGWTPLYHAIVRKQTQFAEILIVRGARVNIKTNKAWSPLMQAVYSGQNLITNKLLVAGGDITVKNKYNQRTLLHYAARNNNTEGAKYFIDNGLSVSAKDMSGFTPLHLAAEKGNVETVKILLDNGASTDCKNRYSFTPLHSALSYKKVDVANLLIDNGANVNVSIKNGPTPLILAMLTGNITLVERIIKSGVDINFTTGQKKWTALHFAAYNGYTEIAKLLIDNGADISIRGKRHQTPLHLAALTGRSEIVDMLLKKGADINQRGANSLTPLDHAIHCYSRKRRLATVRLLLEKGADINKCDGDGWSPVYRCARFNKPEALKMLLKRGAEVNLKDRHGKTALDMTQKQDIKKVLLAYNAKNGKELP